MKYKRLTTDKPQTNVERMLNLAYAKDKKVVLRYAEGKKDVDLCQFIQRNACDITAKQVMDGACSECPDFECCGFGLLYYVGIQAAETRERLKELEDYIDQQTIPGLPFDVGDKVYVKVGCDEVLKERDNETGYTECPFESFCEEEGCKFEKEADEQSPYVILETEVTGIGKYRSSQGFIIEVKHIIRTFRVSDFNKTIFVDESIAKKALKE